MLEMIWPLPCEVSVPAAGCGQKGVVARAPPRGEQAEGGRGGWRGYGPSFRTMIVGVWPPNDMLGGGSVVDGSRGAGGKLVVRREVVSGGVRGGSWEEVGVDRCNAELPKKY